MFEKIESFLLRFFFLALVVGCTVFIWIKFGPIIIAYVNGEDPPSEQVMLDEENCKPQTSTTSDCPKNSTTRTRRRRLDWRLNPANPANPASPLSPFNPIHRVQMQPYRPPPPAPIRVPRIR